MESKGNHGDYTYYLNREEKAEGQQVQPEIEPEAPAGHKEHSPIKDRIDNTISDTAEKLRAHAKKLEGYGQDGSKVNTVVDQVAGGLHKGAEYLESTNLDQMTQKLRKTIGTNQFASLGIAFGIGFVLARVLRK